MKLFVGIVDSLPNGNFDVQKPVGGVHRAVEVKLTAKIAYVAARDLKDGKEFLSLPSWVIDPRDGKVYRHEVLFDPEKRQNVRIMTALED